MKNKFNYIFISVLVFIFASAIMITSYNFFGRNLKRVVFYYPDSDYKILYKETRFFRLDLKNEYFEEKLIKEYLLGPMNYELVLNLEDDTIIKDIWVVQKENVEAIFINFGGNFSNNIINNNESYEWIIKGLIKTLKANTIVKNLYILDNGEIRQFHIGEWEIAYPIIIE